MILKVMLLKIKYLRELMIAFALFIMGLESVNQARYGRAIKSPLSKHSKLGSETYICKKNMQTQG